MGIAITPDSFEYIYKKFCSSLKSKNMVTPSRTEFRSALFLLAAGVNSDDSQYIAEQVLDNYFELMGQTDRS